MRGFVGRTVGAIAPLPTNDRDKPWLVVGANEDPNIPPSAYPLPGIEIRYEDSEMQDHVEGDIEFIVSAYAHHQGAITTMCTGPPTPGSPTPNFLAVGGASGSLSLYPVSPPLEAGAFPLVGVLPEGEMSSSQSVSEAAFCGNFDTFKRKWDTSNEMLPVPLLSPMIKVAATLDGEKILCLKENGSMTLHSVKAISSSPSQLEVDSILAYDACWRTDGGSQVISVGTQQLKVWDVNENSSKPVLSLNSSADAQRRCAFTSVCCAADDMYKVAVGTAQGDILVYDLRMNSSSLSEKRAVHQQAAMIRHLIFHPRNSNLIMSGGDDGVCLLTDLSTRSEFNEKRINAIDRDENYSGEAITLTRSSGFAEGSDVEFGVSSTCVAMCYEPETNYFATAYDNETISVRSRFPYLDKMSRLM